MKNYLITITLLCMTSFGILSQNNSSCPTDSRDDVIVSPKSTTCSGNSSAISDPYYGRYSFYKDIYDIRNVVEIPIDIHVWQKDDSSSAGFKL